MKLAEIRRAFTRLEAEQAEAASRTEWLQAIAQCSIADGEKLDQLESEHHKLGSEQLVLKERLLTLAQATSSMFEIIAKLQHRIERLEEVSCDRYDRFIIPDVN